MAMAWIPMKSMDRTIRALEIASGMAEEAYRRTSELTPEDREGWRQLYEFYRTTAHDLRARREDFGSLLSKLGVK